MFGAIIGIAAKFIGGGAAAGGAGGILGGLFKGGGLLSSLFQGGPLKEIFDMVSNFKSNFLGGASQQPPLGGFGNNGQGNNVDGNSRTQSRLLDRIDSLLNRLERLRGGQGGENRESCRCSNDGFDRIRDLLRQLLGSNNDRSQIGFQVTRSQYLNIQA